jgi:hypothetical protein
MERYSGEYDPLPTSPLVRGRSIELRPSTLGKRESIELKPSILGKEEKHRT